MKTITTENDAMSSRLTTKQRALVDTLVATGCSIKQASQEAGYADGESGRVTASKALKQPHVQAYLMEAVANSLGVNLSLIHI